MLVFFGSTDNKYVLVDGDIEASIRVDGKAVFRIGDDEAGALYLSYTFHDAFGVWGAEIIPTGDICNILASVHIDGHNPIVEIETEHHELYVWDTEMKTWCRVEGESQGSSLMEPF